ncbi:manganese efflux pump MntP family protein [Halanaerocella petrolearia]
MLGIIPIAIALALDAFGVALGIGCGSKISSKERFGLIFSFGLFQFLFSFTGAIVGNYIDSNLFNISSSVSGIIILLLGLLLLKEGYENDETCLYRKIELATYIILGVSVSIDALGVGFSILYNLNISAIIAKTIVIGLICSILTFISFVIVNYIKNFMIVEKYADYLGGLILVVFGLKMIFL